jgi:ferredoxin
MPTVSIKSRSLTVEVSEGEILYDSLSDRGEELPHGCLSGSCGACRIEVIKGQENLSPPGVIEKNTIEALKEEFLKTKGQTFVESTEIRLACRAKVLADVMIEPIP